MSDVVRDCRGVEIKVGSTVVVASASGRLSERVVAELRRPGSPSWWVDVRFARGGTTTPDRCAVVERL